MATLGLSMVARRYADEARWSGRTRGGARLVTFCLALLPYTGARAVRILSYLIATVFLMIGGRRQYGSLQYWRQIAPHAGPIVHGFRTWRRYASFGRILCDRYLAHLRPHTFHYTYNNADLLRRSVGQGKGVILLAAHIGNWELSGHRLHNISSGRIHLVMLQGDNPVVQKFVDDRMREQGVTIINPRDGIGASLAIHAALQRSEVVCMLGDRAHGGQPAVTVRFFGRPARFPIGPFQAAALTGAPIVMCFLNATGDRTYHLTIEPPWTVTIPGRGPARQVALQKAVQAWATRLEQQVRRYPLQWHNFYDFWG